jgi:hypothetical protein
MAQPARIQTIVASKRLQQAGLIVRLTKRGGGLRIFTGEEASPLTWKLIGGLRIASGGVNAAALGQIIQRQDDEEYLAKLDAAIDENSRDAAQAKSEAERRGYCENIEHIETERDRVLDRLSTGA